MQPNHLIDTTAAKNARASLTQTGLPGAKSEAWIYTRLPELVINPSEFSASEAEHLKPGLQFQAGWLVSGADKLAEGITLRAFDEAGDDLAAFAAHLPEEHLLAQLSVGHVTGAYIIDVAEGAQITDILHLDFAAGGATRSSHPLIWLRLAKGASIAVAEHHHSDAALSAPIMVVEVAEEAVFDHAKYQNEASHAHHLALTVLKLAANADVNSFTTATGAALGRHETHAHLDGEGANIALSSIYMGREAQHQDMTTRLFHHVPHCTSSQLIRGVLDDTARGVFQGKVLVAEGAQKTDGQQMSRALLLSRKAEADAKPELEIYADDVVCSHGATVGELDENHMFYLKSRGIEESEARMMLIEAFLLDTLETVRNDALSAMLHDAVQGWMKG